VKWSGANRLLFPIGSVTLSTPDLMRPSQPLEMVFRRQSGTVRCGGLACKNLGHGAHLGHPRSLPSQDPKPLIRESFAGLVAEPRLVPQTVLMRLRVVALAAAILLVSGCGSAVSAATAATGYAATTPTTVTYCAGGGKAQTLDLYEPPSRAPLRPLLIVVHGGSWDSGNSAMDQQNPLTQRVVNDVIARGFAVASINYRLAPGAQWPAQIVDTRCAVRFLRATAARWHVDPQRFSALGDSAGAQLVSLAALSPQQEPQWNSDEYAAQSSALQAVVDCWGPADLNRPGWSRLAIGIGRNVFRATLGSQSDVLRRASPVNYVRPAAPPFLIIQGKMDALVPPQQSTELQSRLVSAGDAATLIDVAHAGHGMEPTGGAIVPSLDALAQGIVSFLLTVAG
jgi:acetyl esterase/lipase